ncbi:hypothetical protein ACFO0N_06170 [Halobium salinum]|uniref:Membrane domain of glycerophosphoryl diester phosphodiesterase n=1 Tax=Halobium salinum TaxID=1364940 RepID=A0ABD5P9F6_9EURY|nr:hypothetical protein [Halobium salinum]
MSWHALDAVDDALSSTRRFLRPSLGRWLRLAVVVFFLGVTSSISSVQNLTNVPQTQPNPGTTPGVSGGPDLLLVAAFAAGAVLLLLVLGTISSTMKFVLVDMLRTDEIRIRRWFRTRVGKGFRLLLFETVVVVLMAAPIAVGVWALVFADGVAPNVGLAGIALGVLALAPYLFVGGLLLSFTNQLVVPVMVATDGGVLRSWRRLWPTLRGQPRQFLAYLVSRWTIAFGIGVVTFTVGLVFNAVLFGVGLAAFLALAASFGGIDAALASTVGIAALVALGLLTLGFFLLVTLPIQVLVHSFLTGYELSVLGRAEPRFALLPETGGGGSGGDPDASTDGPRTVGGGTAVVTRQPPAPGDDTVETDGGSTDDGPGSRDGDDNEPGWG